jgi:uncharacterized protein (TIGR02001 family)
MNKSIVTLASLFAAIAALPVTGHAEDAAPAAAPASPLTFNIGVVSDYRYRGISQTRYKPALQGGADYTFANGFYVGTWASTIKWIKDFGVKGSVEWDIYGGYRGEVAPGLNFDVGLLEYYYIGNKLADTGSYKNANTLEAYGALTYGPITGKVSYALTNLFGNYNFTTNEKTRGSYYLDLSGTFDLGSGFTLVPHLGYQKLEHLPSSPNPSYTDYSITVSKDLGSGFSVSLAGVGTDADKGFYVTGSSVSPSKFLGKNSLVAGLKYAF